jgi:very-short-patch-repair endonuclease
VGVNRSMTIHRIKPETTRRARSLRAEMTDVERLLWQALRYKQVNGNRFRRQHPIGRYIVDFACIEQKLVIELDGGQHQEQVAYDEQRTASLQAQGWQVLRFWNNDILNNLEGVLTRIAENLTAAPPS